MREALSSANLAGKDVASIGFSGQMHGAVLLDEGGNVVRPALIWCDARTEKQCRELTRALGLQRLIQLTSNPTLPNFTLTKVLWVRENEPDQWKRVRYLLLPKDYVRFRLTGERATDMADASGTLLLDVSRRRWSSELLDAAALEESLLPALDSRGRIHTFCHTIPGRWHVMGVTQAVGLSLRRFRDTFIGRSTGARESYDHLTAEAAKIPPGSDGLLRTPYLMGERTPHLDGSARGALVGLTASHTRGHIVRAILEGVASSLRDTFTLFQGDERSRRTHPRWWPGRPLTALEANSGRRLRPFGGNRRSRRRRRLWCRTSCRGWRRHLALRRCGFGRRCTRRLAP